MNLTLLPFVRSDHDPDGPAVADDRYSLSNAGFAGMVEGYARHFARHGVGRGDIVTGDRSLPDLPGEDSGLDDLALVIYTSGTTGRPKGVELLHRNLDAMTAAMIEAMALTSTGEVPVAFVSLRRVTTSRRRTSSTSSATASPPTSSRPG